VGDVCRLEAVDLDACLALSVEAGWNQNANDWRLILDQGHVVGMRRPRDGVPIATAAVLPYGGRFGWICMVLVTAAERRRGHATRLVAYCLDWLNERQLIPGLDATPAGREVYRGLGFRDIYPITRLQSAGVAAMAPQEADADIARLESADLGVVAAYDAAAFGADRAPVLAALQSRRPHMAFVARRRGAVCGYVVSRDGRSATQLGPVVADDGKLARALMARALAQVGGPLFLDLADHHKDIAAWLGELGFAAQRPYMRMLVGRPQPLDSPERTIAIAGPELG
jgi:GNAT superfamily N-acetyltransferase